MSWLSRAGILVFVGAAHLCMGCSPRSGVDWFGSDGGLDGDADAVSIDGDADLSPSVDGDVEDFDGGRDSSRDGADSGVVDAGGDSGADGDVEEQPPTNEFGVWLWYLEQLADRGITSHGQLARRLADLGVKRIYVKVADGNANCEGTWPEACDAAIPDAYHAEGLGCWAWAYNYPADGGNTNEGQAEALRRAAEAGYDGFVLDIEIEFDYATTALEALLEAFTNARAEAIAEGDVSTGWPIYVTTWGNPADHGMRVDIIDAYVDGHMPQSYLEVWGETYMIDGPYWISYGTCEYRSLGAEKPVHHILSTERGVITPSQLNAALAASTAESSIWRIPGGEVPESVWTTWEGIDWSMSSFETAECL